MRIAASNVAEAFLEFRATGRVVHFDALAFAVDQAGFAQDFEMLGEGSIAVVGGSIYSATKAAVISLGKSLAVELAPRGVRVNVLSPGPIDTPILKKVGLPADQLKEFEASFAARSLLKRFGTSDEVARAARFLLSEDSSNITGTELIIDGGVRLN